MDAIKVVVLSKDIQFAEELNLLIDAQPHMYCIGILSSFEQDVALLSRAQVVVIDHRMYARDIDYFSDLTSEHPDLSFIALHETDEFEQMYLSLKFGADMCLEMSKIETFLPALILHITIGEKVMNARLAARMLTDLAFIENQYNYSHILTDKETEFLEMFAKNFSRKEIAIRLRLDAKDLNTQISSIFDKIHRYSKKHIYDSVYA